MIASPIPAPFVADILPALRSQGVTCPVAWVGRVTDSEQRELSSFVGLQMTGYVDDVRPYLARANAFIAPIRVGGGTRLKILDAWAMATPIVGTRAAMEGLDAADGKNFLGAETPNEFCAGIKRILCDPELAAGLGAEGRRAVESTFGWARIGADLRTSYADLAASTQGATRSTDAPSQA